MGGGGKSDGRYRWTEGLRNRYEDRHATEEAVVQHKGVTGREGEKVKAYRVRETKRWKEKRGEIERWIEGD